MQNFIESDSTAIWVAVIFISTSAVSFLVNTIRYKRNRAFDAAEREEQAAVIKDELASAVKFAKKESADIALKVEDALHRQQHETDLHLTKQSAMVEEVLKRQEVATRTDVIKSSKEIKEAIKEIEKPKE